MLRRAAAAVAALGLAALALAPGTAATASTIPQPDGGGTGWTLVENQAGDQIDSTWDIPGQTGPLCNQAAPVMTSGSAIEFWTSGLADGNCARAASPWTIAPTAAHPTVWIEYDATMPTDTWAALWATGDPGPWPNTGEIDGVEVLAPDMECHSYHYETSSGTEGSLGGFRDNGAHCGTVDSAPAIYGVEWSVGSLKFYINGIHWDTLSSSVIGTDPERIMLDNKTGGWDQAPGPASTMSVYYVRAWYK